LTNTTPAIQPGSEDCLLLDVLVPQTVNGPNLPVIVQIHGGGYAGGNSETYPGYALVNQTQGGLIYVSIQYRLGAFGFLSSVELRENGVANAGLLDQRAALMWVQRNIRAFGGTFTALPARQPRQSVNILTFTPDRGSSQSHNHGWLSRRRLSSQSDAAVRWRSKSALQSSDC
jgi:hypothetical protein